MPLQPGTALGSYSVTAKIGEGGMGEVYRARDTKLDRDVALKVLPQAFTDDPDRLARFEREAKVLASLNHPNIGGIHGLEESDGIRALVLEYIEGPTLADRIAKGPIPIDEALPIAKQIAEALEAAHEAGVIHRDLKPANIKLKPDGTVKVLDFGLAKALDTTPQGDPSLSPTLTAAATQMGVIMGTAAYMSPEQARGKVVDTRADVWSFGAVLFEMLSGRRPFEGRDVSEVLAGVIRTEPQWDALTDTPPHLTVLLKRCLEKEARQRVQAAGDVRLALEGAFETATVSTSEAVAPQPGGWQQALPWVAGLLLAAMSSLAVWTFTRPPDTLTSRFTIEPPPGVQFNPWTILTSAYRISPDGRMVAFQGLSENAGQVYLRSLGQLEAVPLRGTENAAPLAFSPDGLSLLVMETDSMGLFVADGDVKRIALAGGPPTTVAQGAGSAAWGPDDTVVLANPVGGLQLIRASGGAATPLTTLAEGEIAHYLPTFLPNGRAVLFHAYAGDPATSQIAVYDFETETRTNLLQGTAPSFATTGHLVFWRDGSLWAVPFDPDRFEVGGDPVGVVEGVSAGPYGAAAYSLANNGTLAYARSGTMRLTSTLGWVDRNGVMTTPVFEGDNRAISYPRLSPDGSRVVFSRGDVWVRDLARGSETKLTETGGHNSYPVWTPDGEAVTFSDGERQLVSRPVDLSRETELVRPTEGLSFAGSWTPDGRTHVYYAFSGGSSGRDIWMLPVDGDPTPFLATDFSERGPRLSPDGEWIAYISDQAGEDRVYVQAFPEGGQVFNISTGPGTEVVWSRDGTELFYRNRDEMWVVPVETESGFTAGRPELLFEAPYSSWSQASAYANYDVSLDGQQFLMVQGDTAGETSPLIVVLNWFEELTRLVPTN
jgi:serine/threonine-protein kinase